MEKSSASQGIDLHQAEEFDETAFEALVREAVALNRSGKSKTVEKPKSRGIARQDTRSREHNMGCWPAGSTAPASSATWPTCPNGAGQRLRSSIGTAP